LPSYVVEVLREHWERQERERVALAEKWPRSGYVFTSVVGTPIDPRNCTRMVQNACKGAGVRVVRLHDFRHGCVSILLELGVPPRVDRVVPRDHRTREPGLQKEQRDAEPEPAVQNDQQLTHVNAVRHDTQSGFCK
jgi:integrase